MSVTEMIEISAILILLVLVAILLIERAKLKKIYRRCSLQNIDCKESRVNLEQGLISVASRSAKSNIAGSIFQNTEVYLDEVSSLVVAIREHLEETLVADMLKGEVEQLARDGKIENEAVAHLERVQRELTKDHRNLSNFAKAIDGAVAKIVKGFESQNRYLATENIPEKLDVAELLKDLITILSPTFKKQFIQVHLMLGPKCYVFANKSLLMAAFYNIIINSIEAEESSTPPRSIHVTLAHQEKKVAIKIKDNGIGATPTLLENALRLGSTTKPHSQGIGLFDTKNIIESANGKLSIESNENEQGVMVTIDLPHA